MTKHILIAPNAFKHSLSAVEIAKIIKSGLDSSEEKLSCEIAPIADGGDGTSDVIKYYFPKSKFIDCNVHDPLMRMIKSKWLLLEDGTAVIELAKASGLSLLAENELNPMWANTFGTGELILSALDKGCKKIILTLGGSATIDAGMGVLEALKIKVLDKGNKLLKPGGGFLSSIKEINLREIDKRIKGCEIHALCDVRIPLTGENGAVNKFGTQKGAKEGEKVILEQGMKNLAMITKKITGFDFEKEPMVGAAGGVAFTVKAFLGANLHPGFIYLSNLIKLEEMIKRADIIITSEGSLDAQTLMGKGVFELAKLGKKYKKKIIVFCGKYDKDINWSSQNIDSVFQIKPDDVSEEESILKANEFLKKAVETASKYL